MKQKNILITVSILFVLVAWSVPSLAQLAPSLPDPNGAPIDGGLSVLIAAGAGYGIKKMREKRKKD
jgi:hypothetical protein